MLRLMISLNSLALPVVAVAFLLSVGVSFAADVTVEVIHPETRNGAHSSHEMTLEQANSDALPKAAVEIDQITDNMAYTPLELFRFEPDFVEIEPGQTIRFLNSTGNHTVKSIPTMMPDEAEAFDISHQPVADVTFDKEGVYGIRCKVHGRHGMVMLVKVGNNLTNLDEAKSIKHNPAVQMKFDQLFAKIK